MKYKKKKLSFSEYGRKLSLLYLKIREEVKKIDLIYGIPRGGLPIATYLSHHLETGLITDLDRVKEYIKSKRILIVDDISDTGNTFNNFPKEILTNNNCVTATIFYKPHSMYKPNYYVDEVNNNLWIVFPYERYDSEINR